MPRKNVTEEDLNSSYLSQMMGETDEDTNDGSGVVEEGEGEEGEGDGQTRQAQRQTRQSDRTVDDDERARSGKPPKKDAQRQQQEQNRLGPDGKPLKGQQQPQHSALTNDQELQVYHQLKQRIQPVINKIEKERDFFKQQVAVHEARVEVARKFNLNEKEQLEAFQLAAALKTNPAATVKYLLEKAQAAGHNVQIGNAQAGLSPEAIKHMIAEQLQPVTQRAQQQNEYDAHRAQVQEQIVTFFQNFPEAEAQSDALNLLLQKNPNLTLEQGYIKLRELFVTQGLDWNVPLATHLYNLQQLKQNGGQRQQQRRPNMNGRGGNAIARQEQEEERDDTDMVADVSTPRRDIIRRAMRANGYNVNLLD